MTLLRQAGICIAFTLFFMGSACAKGPGFDCAKAGTKIEKMICADGKLSELDLRLGRAYAKALKSAKNPAAFRQQQRDWLKARNACRTKSCLRASYKSRLALLAAKMGSVLAPQAETDLSPAQTPPCNFKLARNTGWTVCRDLLKNYKKLQPPKESFACEIRFDPSMAQLGWPKWQELKIEDYLDVIYTIESHIPPSGKLPPFDVWRAQYLADMNTGFSLRQAYGGKQVRAGFHPRLRQTRVRFESGGSLETVLGYTGERLAGERCKDSLKECPLPVEDNSETHRRRHECVEKLYEKWGDQMDRPGEHIVLYEPEARHVRFIQPGDKGVGMSSRVSGHLFLHRKRAYLALVTVLGISVSRIERIEFESPAIMPLESGRQVCDMLFDYRR